MNPYAVTVDTAHLSQAHAEDVVDLLAHLSPVITVAARNCQITLTIEAPSMQVAVSKAMRALEPIAAVHAVHAQLQARHDRLQGLAPALESHRS